MPRIRLIVFRKRFVSTVYWSDANPLQWISEVLHFNPGIPIFLIGTKKDLRHDARTIEQLRKTSQKVVSYDEVSLSSGH
jgi:GTPase SAR1 family protein